MKIELSVHASKLQNAAGMLKISSPFFILTKLATEAGKSPEVLGRSEVVKNNLSPDWVRVFHIDYQLGETIKVAVSIFDEVKKGDNKSMGSAIFDVAELLGARGNTKAKQVMGGGIVFMRAQKCVGQGVLRFSMKGCDLKNVEGVFRKSDPFFEIRRKVDAPGGQSWDTVYRSESVPNNLNPVWKEAALELSVLCGGDLDLPFKIAVFDYEKSGKHTPMGEIQTTLNGMQQAATAGNSFALRQMGQDVGTIEISKASVDGAAEELSHHMSTASISNPTSAPSGKALSSSSTTPQSLPPQSPTDFLDYISGGCRLNVSVAIDFTGSNGDPTKPGTLHHFNYDGSRNDYEKAIAAIVSILAKYDSDQMFPVYGFGAKYGGVVQHCFECGGAPEHKGVKGVLEAYRQTFQSGLIMSRPTVYTEVVRAAALRAQAAQDAAMLKGEQCYTVLLILTDGEVSDVQATTQCLEEVSSAPLSIVIVGIGSADFSGMQVLDDFRRKDNKRDIVHFVNFNHYSNCSEGLALNTLGEIPAQLSGYFRGIGIPPSPAIRTNGDVAVDEMEEDYIDLSLDINEDKIIVTRGGADFEDGFNAGRY